MKIRNFIFTFSIVFASLFLAVLWKKSHRFLPHSKDFASTTVVDSCRVRKLQGPLTPEVLRQFLQDPRVESIEDLVCCLPDRYLANHVTMDTSFALQRGVPNNPRVLFYNDFTDQESVITITGSDPSIPGNDHVEAFFHNVKEDKNELYDIDFSRRPQLSEKNPRQCMGCHGPNLSEVAIAGAKPIFQESPWPQAFGAGIRIDCNFSSSSCPPKYFSHADDHAKAALKTQARYRCVTPPETEDVDSYDRLIESLNSRRVAKLIEQTPNYKKIRPLLVGLIRCLSPDVISESGLQSFDHVFSQWVPRDMAEKIFTDDKFISPHIRGVDNLLQARLDHRDSLTQQREIIRKKRTETDIGTTLGLYLPTENFVLNENGSQKIDMNSLEDQAPTSLSKFSPVTQLLARYALDTDKELHIGEMDPRLRFLFEARGISTLTWVRDLGGGHAVTLFVPLDELRALEKQDPFWKGATGEVSCEALRKESYRNFQNWFSN